MTRSTLLGAAAVGALTLASASGAAAQETTTTWRGAPQFANDTLTFKVRGRVYLDYVFQDVEGSGLQASGFTSTNTPDYDARNSRLRTARLGVEGTWNANWAYKAEVSVVNGTANWEDLILEYKPTDTSSLMIGNFKTLGLEEITSSRYNVFMERGPYADFVQTGRVANIAYKLNGVNWTALGAVSGGTINSNDQVGTLAGTQGDERLGVNGRVTFAPVDTDTTKVHLGAWARYRDRGDESGFAYSARPNTNAGNSFINTGAIANSDTSFAVEGALVHKSVSVQGEFSVIDYESAGATPDGQLTGGYVFVSWFPTGETRRYEANRGEFNRTRILNPVTAGGFGAVELAARYDRVDLDEAFFATTVGEVTTPFNTRAGVQESYTVGANWYPFPYVRFQANYTHAEADNNASNTAAELLADADVDTFQVRAQFDF